MHGLVSTGGLGKGQAVALEPLTGEDPVQVAGYQLRARLGAGGMGRVYLAFTPGGRPVALKVVRPEYGDDEDFRARFRHEIESARQVHGLYTAQVLDAGPDAIPPWLVTAYVPGPSLAQAVRDYGPMPAETVLLLMAGVAEALQAIHAAGVVHRDLKPSNVLLAPDGPRVIDFGIARAVEGTAVTRTGMRVGSPQFMAPEQIAGRSVAPAIDVFALGSLATFAVLGRPPFGEGGEAAVMYRILNEPPDLGDCPEPLRGLLGRCLAKEPAERPGPGEIISTCRANTAGKTLQIAQSWLPAGVAAILAEHAAPPAPPALPAAAGAQPPASGAPTAYPPPLPGAVPGVAVPGAVMPGAVVPGVAAAAGAMPPPAAGPAGTWALQPGGAPGGRRLSRAAIVAGAATAVVIAAVAVAATLLAVRGPDGTGGPANGTGGQHPPAEAGASSGTGSSPGHGKNTSATVPPARQTLSQCAVGKWKGVTEDVINKINNAGVAFNGRGPADEVIKANGRGVTNYGNRAVFRATVNGNKWAFVVHGYATYQWQTQGNRVMLIGDVKSHGSWQLLENGLLNNSGTLNLVTGAENDSCSGNIIRSFTSQGSMEMKRVLPKPQPGS
jgi:protein kinase-like protein